MDEEIFSQIRIERPLYEHDQLRQDLCYEKPRENYLTSQCGNEKLKIKHIITGLIPVLGWLPHYQWKRDILSDIISGITVAIMHIPQGMAYALLGNVPPVIGIYMAVFPVLIYFFFGTSRHNSMGTFSIAILMTGKAVLEHSDPIYFQANTITNSTDTTVVTGYTPIQVATAVTFLVAIFQLIMCALRLGAVSVLLSETLVNGFTTAAAVQVLVSQLKDLLGLRIPKFKGYFVVVNTLVAIVNNLGDVNLAAITISAVTIIISTLNNELLKPIIAKKSQMPVPIELIAVVLGTLASKYGNLPEVYGIKIVGDIPSGLPAPTIPAFDLFPSIILDALTIAIVSYTITLSMALIFAQKLNYEVDANQELFALGTSNIFGAFFSCMPLCASLSRSLIQQVVGGKTQIVSIVSSGILVCVLLWIGPFFEPLPKCVLASVIVVALKGMLMQATSLWRFWKLSKMDALVWLATFSTVVFVGIDIGLLTGLSMSLVTIFVLGFKPYTCLLGSVPQTDLYLDVNRYKGTKEIEGIKIFHYCGGINFATTGIFKADLFKLVQINPLKELVYRAKLLDRMSRDEDDNAKINKKKIEKLQRKINADLKCLIMDFSSVSYIDPSGISMLKGVIESFQKLDISVYIAGSSDPVYNMMEKCNLFQDTKPSIRIFPSIHDAVQCCSSLYGINADSSVSTVRL